MSKLVPASLLVVAAGCSGLSVSTDYDTSADFTALRTYSWYPEKAPPGEAPEVSSLINARIRSALEAELAAKGYTEAVNAAPDFLAAYRAAVDRKIESRPTATSVGYGWGAGYMVTGTELYAYDEGTLVIDFIDPKTKTLLWRGVARKVVDRDASAEKRDRTIREAVRKILEEFPPGR